MDKLSLDTLRGAHYLGTLMKGDRGWYSIMSARRSRWFSSISIVWRDSGKRIKGTPKFTNMLKAMVFMHQNWKRFVDEAFEQEVLK